jgi:predicted nucleic acid-binding Zn ribbon protein
MAQTTFQCACCNVFYTRTGNTAAWHRKKLKDRGYVFCSKSCGSYKHGGSKNKTPEYSSWNAMKDRCNNPKHESYLRYGGRGITYDPSWNNFKVFLEDMGTKLNPKMELERINNNENYCKENCRWATHKEQTRNRGGKRATRLYTFNEKTLCIADWAKEVGISPQCMQKRLNKGWELSRAFNYLKN